MTDQITYHGLMNHGATCYLNGVLQVLFMTKDFREAVQRYTSENLRTDCIDPDLKDLFDDLKRHTTYTYKILNKLGIIKVNEQRDAAEYYEKILNLTSPEASQIFHGELTHKTICATCQTETNRDAGFWHLPLPLMDSYSKDYDVVDGIKEYFRDSHFTGLDQMYCDQCDDKSDVTIKCEVKHHPEVLMLLLKRFEFNYNYMMYVKINRVVDVPYTLQIPQNQSYDLYAVVDHFGDLRGGHYRATIKSQDDDNWYNFDDTRVTKCDYQPFQGKKTEKSQNVYLLFYRKQKRHDKDTCTEGTKDESINGDLQPATSKICDQSQESEETEERPEDKEFVEVDNDNKEAAPDNMNEETGTEDSATVTSPVVEPESDHEEHYTNDGNVRQDVSYRHENQRNQGKIKRNVNEGERRDGEPDEKTGKREPQSEERVEDQSKNSVGLDYIKIKLNVSHSDNNPVHDLLNKQNEMSGDQSRDDDGQTEQLVRENLNMNPELQVSEGLDDVRKAVSIDNNEETGTEDSATVTSPVVVTRSDLHHKEHHTNSFSVSQDVMKKEQEFSLKPDVSDRHQVHDPLNKQEETSDEQRGAIDVKTDSDEQSEQVVTENINRNPELQVSEGLEDVRRVKVKNHGDTKHVYSDKQGDEKIEPVNTEEKSREREVATGSRKSSMRHDLPRYNEGGDDEQTQRKSENNEGVENQHKKKLHDKLKHVCVELRGEEEIIKLEVKKDKKHLDDGGDVEQNKPNDNQECKRGISDTSGQSEDRHRHEINNDPVQRRRSSERYCGDAEQSQDDVRQHRPQENRHKDVGIKTKSREEDQKQDRSHTEDRQKFSPGQQGLTGGRGLKQKPVSEQPDKRSIAYSVEEGMMGGEGPSVQHRGNRNVGEIQNTVRPIKMMKRSVQETSTSSNNRSNQRERVERVGDPKTDKSVNTLKLSDSHFPETKKTRTSGNRKTSEVLRINATQKKKEKKKHKTPGCFCMFSKEPHSES